MTSLRFDHFISYTSAADIDDCRKSYEAQGFAVSERTVRHEPGLRNGFVLLGPEYLEFAWVEDEALFDRADATEKMLRSTHRPFGIGIVADDVSALHAEWTGRGYTVPPVWSKAPRDAAPGTPPAWSFLEIPAALLPGACCFALTYHARTTRDARQVRVPPNTMYAIVGITFVTSDPEARATAWRDVLAPAEAVVRTDDIAAVAIGAHVAEWMTPDVFRSRLGLPWTPAPDGFGELAALRLVATDLDQARRVLAGAGREVRSLSIGGADALRVMPDARDGFAFTVEARPVETWLAQRVARTGEHLHVDDA